MEGNFEGEGGLNREGGLLTFLLWKGGLNRGFTVSSVFVYPHVHVKTAFSESSTLESVFKKLRFHWSFLSDTCRIHKEKFAFSNENGYVWTGLNKQKNNARTSNIFVHFSDDPARMWREILSSDVLGRWRNFFITPILRYPAKTTFLNVPEIYLPKCNARFTKK